jgi:PAS domain-containing protein
VPDAPFTPSLPLILARELASNLATPMFLVDSRGMLVFYNDAAELLIGKPFAELGAIDALEFGSVLHMTELDGEPVRRRYSPAGIAFAERRPSHQQLLVTGYDGIRRAVEATAYPLLGAHDELHGVVVVFWEVATSDGPR